jgi:hypothetical protein
MGHQCQYILCFNASNNDAGNLQPDNKHATPYAYVSNNVNCYYYTHQQFSMHQQLHDINYTHFFLYFINDIKEA